jgi:UDP-N-acetylglucosamine 2-epimerase (non-hydrolysing)/GDP/UDP-N,N'-diacetylbacillosamine 2-epimerase (hydrolysing)
MRKIAIVTGTRGEYGIYTSVLDAIDAHPDIEYELIVTCMHLSEQFGHTIDEIRKDGRKIGAEVDMLKYPDTLAGMSKNAGVAIIGMTEAIEKIKPDIVLVLGDRDEQLAGAIAGAHMNIPVAHLHGGEMTGTLLDENIRHAITKYSHIHLPATKRSAEYIERMGEPKENIILVGAAGVDSVKRKGKMSREELAKRFDFDPNKRIILSLQYPVTTQYEEMKQQMEEVMDALLELNEQTVYVYSNSDAGHTEMMEVLEEKVGATENKIKIFKSLSYEVYLSLMKTADVMMGNSSSGVLEAPSCETPYVLIGTRQQGREQAASIQEIPCKKEDILKAVDKALNDEEFKEIIKTCEKPYDPFNDDNSGKRIAEALATFDIEKPELLQKKLTYPYLK